MIMMINDDVDNDNFGNNDQDYIEKCVLSPAMPGSLREVFSC